MTDWDFMVEQIHRAMQFVDQAAQASQALKRQTTAENLNAFQNEVRILQEELVDMQWAMEHPGQYSMDEVISALNEMFSGKPTSYRTSTKIELHNP